MSLLESFFLIILSFLFNVWSFLTLVVDICFFNCVNLVCIHSERTSISIYSEWLDWVVNVCCLLEHFVIRGALLGQVIEMKTMRLSWLALLFVVIDVFWGHLWHSQTGLTLYGDRDIDPVYRLHSFRVILVAHNNHFSNWILLPIKLRLRIRQFGIMWELFFHKFLLTRLRYI